MARTQAPENDWVDPDDAPELTDEALQRAQIAVGGRVVREARGTLTRWFTREEMAKRVTK